uniref:Uncharacterized protein n=1 Tax=Knipowitschia caucasica TaxID=637954 RepID=A0AAV2LY27_KNICA
MTSTESDPSAQTALVPGDEVSAPPREALHALAHSPSPPVRAGHGSGAKEPSEARGGLRTCSVECDRSVPAAAPASSPALWDGSLTHESLSCLMPLPPLLFTGITLLALVPPVIVVHCSLYA